VNDPIDRLIMERAALDRGFSRGMWISAIAHLTLVAVAIAGPMLAPKKPALTITPVFAVQIPRGVLDPGPGPKPKADPAKPDPPKPEPSRKKELIKPPKEEKTGLPLKDLKKPAKSTPTAAPVSDSGGGNNPLGVDIGPPGLPEGNAFSGDFFMGSVVAKIARIWRSRIQQGLTTAVVIRFTILADGSVTDVQIIESSGAYLVDSAAKSAVATAAPFGKLPAHYDTQYCNAARCTVQVRFTR
jgi:periplasmic protein TonB